MTQLAVRELSVRDQRPATPWNPPPALQLPLRLRVPFAVGTLNWQATVPMRAQDIAGIYYFDSKLHKLDKGQIRISSGKYQLEGQLDAQAPLALSVALTGTLQTHLPRVVQPILVNAQARLSGTLAGPEAALRLSARLQPALGAAPGTTAMQAELSALIRPGQAQPLAQAQAAWQSLDLAALWPQAPHTLLDGQAAVTPLDGRQSGLALGTDWRAELQLVNRRPGPWDQQALPFDRLKGSLAYRQGAWAMESVQAQGPAGRLEGQGELASAAGGQARWRGSARLYSLNPRALHTRLPAGALDGDILAADSGTGLAFETRLQTRTGLSSDTKAARLEPDALQQLGQRIRNLQAKGRWAAPQLQLDEFALDATDTRLEGQLTLDTTSLAMKGSLRMALPGARAEASGELAPDRGEGLINLGISDAALASGWIARGPLASDQIARLDLRGQGSLSAQWRGGWQRQGRDLQLQARLQIPRLDAGDPARNTGTHWRLRDTQAEAQGRLADLRLTVRGQFEQAGQSIDLVARGHALQKDPGHWQLQLEPEQLDLHEGQARRRWQLKLAQPLLLDAQLQADSTRLLLAAGTATLTGPAPGPVQLSWQPARWAQEGSRAQARTDWQTQGSVKGLTLAWLEWLGQTQIANLGLRGDLVFGGQWEANGGQKPTLRASLQRTAGDLQLLAEDPAAAALRAGVKQARLDVELEGEQLSARLSWDSERAGQAQAAMQSRVDTAQGAWQWRDDAPLSGTLNVQLPPVGAWSLLAPPGWRLRGTLDADATLSGTRGAPRWQGQLRANELAVRSVADGIDFSRGSLRARLDEQGVRIESFTLQGATAGASDGGLVTVTGSVLWLASGDAARPLLERLRMDLNAQARSLRVSARADRRLVVSGQLDAQLREGKFSLRGALKADQALFILPEDTAPQLGSDVRVRRPEVAAAPKATPERRSGRLAAELRVALDLGPDFQVRGRGLSTRIAGNVALRNASPGSLTPLLQGELRAVQGSYRAYGQNLDIEEGVLRFSGPYDNPALDILALRPNLQQRVGVQITGTVISPIVRLYASPELPDAEKLAWLVLGRAAAGGGAEAAVLQQAALALLGGNARGLSGGLAQALGLDEVSLRGASSNLDGSTTGATVTLGKRLSRDFYVAYERSLAGTLGTLYIFYDLSRRFTLRAQTGEHSAVDLIFTLRYE